MPKGVLVQVQSTAPFSQLFNPKQNQQLTQSPRKMGGIALFIFGTFFPVFCG
jgi:hypothetical protein